MTAEKTNTTSPIPAAVSSVVRRLVIRLRALYLNGIIMRQPSLRSPWAMRRVTAR